MAEEGGTPGAELKIRLVVDDQSKEVLDLLKNNLEDVKEKTHETGTSVGMIAKGVAMGNVAAGLLKESFMAVGEAVRSTYEMLERFAETAIDAASGEDDQVRSMTGLVFLLDKGQHSMAGMAQYAEQMHDELEEAGRKVGVNDVLMTDTFNTIVAKGALSTEKAKELTEQMAEVGRVTEGGIKGLGQGFSMIEMGMIRARNPIVELIVATGLLKGNAHEVAKAMMKMTPEKQLELATKAISTQSANMKTGGGPQMTIAEMRTSLGGYREMFYESVGHPIIGVLMPALKSVQAWLGENRDAINNYAVAIGDDIGLVVRATEQAFGGIYRAVWLNWTQIDTMFERIFGDWRAAWNHAEGKGQGIYKMFRDMTTGLVDAFERMMWMAHTVGDIFMKANDIMKSQPVGTTALQTQQSALMERSEQFGDSHAIGSFDEAARRFKAMAEEMPDISQMAVDELTKNLRSHLEENLKNSELLKDNVATDKFDEVSNWINSSMKNNQENAQVYVVSLLAQSDAAMNALKTGAIHIDAGMDALIKTVSEKSPEVGRAFKEALTRMQGGGIRDIAGRGALNFNMHNTQIHIKQDFRNEDPDRIALIMRRDLVKTSVARVQSRATSPFGL